MKHLFATFRVLYRNFGMVWPPFVTFAAFFLMIFFFVLLIGGGLMLSGSSFFKNGMPELDMLTGIGIGLGLLAIGLFLLFLLISFLLGAFVSGGIYKMVSDVLNGERHYWRSFGKGGLRYLGWGALYLLITIILAMMGQLIIELSLAGEVFMDNPPIAVGIANTVYSFILSYLFAMFYPALVDGKLGFGKALGTSFRLAWKTFLITIIPAILLILMILLVGFALVGIASLTHWIVSVLLAIPLILYMIPFTQVWMTLVYRHLTGANGSESGESEFDR
jgi:hypothetical protein